MPSVLLLVSLVSVGLMLLAWIWRRRHLYRLSWKCDGPVAFPIIGNALILRNMDDNMKTLDALCNQHSSPLRFWGGTSLYLVVHDADDIETILRSPHCLKRMYIYDFLRDSISDTVDGLFTSNGATWKLHRRYVGQSFGLNAIYNSLPIFNKHARLLANTLSREIGKEVFDVRLKINRATIDMFLESAIGTDFTADDKKRYSHYLSVGQEILSRRLFLPWFHIDWIWKLTGYPKLLKKYTDFGSKLVNSIIATKLSAKSGDLTFIDRLLRVSEENEKFTLEDVRAETTTLLMGGSDTTAVTVAFVVLMLAMHTDYQERCFQEIKRILPDPNEDITTEHLMKLEYTEQCIKETLRLYPTVAVIGRCTEKSIKLKDITVNAGQSVMIAIRQVMRKKKYWGHDANDFNPDHCSVENMSKIPQFAYIPFSDGARICIAYKYAMVVLKVLIVQLFRNHRYSTHLKPEELKIRMNVNSRLLNDHMVQIHRRTEE